jgi:hypothetical protein
MVERDEQILLVGDLQQIERDTKRLKV